MGQRGMRRKIVISGLPKTYFSSNSSLRAIVTGARGTVHIPSETKARFNWEVKKQNSCRERNAELRNPCFLLALAKMRLSNTPLCVVLSHPNLREDCLRRDFTD